MQSERIHNSILVFCMCVGAMVTHRALICATACRCVYGLHQISRVWLQWFVSYYHEPEAKGSLFTATIFLLYILPYKSYIFLKYVPPSVAVRS